jgi:anti-sigma B factor antagonist
MNHNGEPEEPGLLHVESDQGLKEGYVAAVGQLDISSAPTLQVAIGKLEAQAPSLLTVDLSGLEFMDSTGLHLLLEAHQRAVEQGRRLVIVRPPAAVHRLFDITGTNRVLEFL